MSKFLLTCTLLAVSCLCGTAEADNGTEKPSQVVGFLAGSAGVFSLSLPDNPDSEDLTSISYGFDDVYGSKQGLSVGGEAGIGLKNLGLFAVLKARYWKKTGTPVTFGGIDFSGSTEWTQNFASIGIRYILIHSLRENSKIVPFIGAGAIRTVGSESLDGEWDLGFGPEPIHESIDVDGNGFYLEGGTDVLLSPSVSLRLGLEYSDLSLSLTDIVNSPTIDGGGGLFAAVSLNFFLGKFLPDDSGQ